MKTGTRMGLLAVGMVALTALAMDRNNNGVSDVYERFYSLDAVALESDLDGDGFISRDEAVFGTDPRSATSRPAIALTDVGGARQLRWQSVRGVRYRIESSSDLAAWSQMGGYPHR